MNLSIYKKIIAGFAVVIIVGVTSFLFYGFFGDKISQYSKIDNISLSALVGKSVSEETTRVIIGFRDDILISEIEKKGIIEKYKGIIYLDLDFIDAKGVIIPIKNVDQLKKEPLVWEVVDSKIYFELLVNLNVPATDSLAPEANQSNLNNFSLKSKEIKVGIMDTGIDPSKIKSKYIIVEKGKNLVDPSDPNGGLTDDVGHGTQVAQALEESLEALNANLPDDQKIHVRIVPYKVMSTKENTSKDLADTGHIVKAIEQAVKDKVDTLNYSFTNGAKENPIIRRAIKKAKDRGVLSVAASGNCGRDCGSRFPADYEDIMSVGSKDSNGQISHFSRNADIYSNGSIKSGEIGTSLASPRIALLAALLKNLSTKDVPSKYDTNNDGTLDNDEVKRLIKDSAGAKNIDGNDTADFKYNKNPVGLQSLSSRGSSINNNQVCKTVPKMVERWCIGKPANASSEIESNIDPASGADLNDPLKRIDEMQNYYNYNDCSYYSGYSSLGECTNVVNSGFVDTLSRRVGISDSKLYLGTYCYSKKFQDRVSYGALDKLLTEEKCTTPKAPAVILKPINKTPQTPPPPVSTPAPPTKGLVPCSTDCNFQALISGINGIIQWLAKFIAMPLAAIAFSYAGWLYITGGSNSSKREQAHEIFTNVIIGMFFVFGAWLLVVAILNGLGLNPSYIDTYIQK